MKVTLHIGTPKAASTSIQHFMSANRRDLHEKHGILYPIAGTTGLAHHGFAVLLEDSRRSRAFPSPLEPSDLWAEIKSSGVDHVVISSEWLTFANRLDRIPSLLPSARIELVVLLRRQDLFVESLPREALKRRRVTTDYSTFVRRTRVSYAIDYRALIERWTRAIGDDLDSVVVIPFEPTEFERPIEAEFLRSIGIATPSIDEHESRVLNRALSRDALEFLQCIYRDDEPLQLRNLIGALTRFSRDNPDPRELKYFADGAIRASFLDEFKAINSWVERSYLDGRELFVTAPSPDEPWAPYRGLTKSALIEIAKSIARANLT